MIPAFADASAGRLDFRFDSPDRVILTLNFIYRHHRANQSPQYKLDGVQN
ncbi:MAG: hypothetical protein Q8K98_11900 [Bacteroidota bacterium]|nr:hypothetical protein [Bacteroidota bacterium]